MVAEAANTSDVEAAQTQGHVITVYFGKCVIIIIMSGTYRIKTLKIWVSWKNGGNQSS